MSFNKLTPLSTMNRVPQHILDVSITLTKAGIMNALANKKAAPALLSYGKTLLEHGDLLGAILVIGKLNRNRTDLSKELAYFQYAKKLAPQAKLDPGQINKELAMTIKAIDSLTNGVSTSLRRHHTGYKTYEEYRDAFIAYLQKKPVNVFNRWAISTLQVLPV